MRRGVIAAGGPSVPLIECRVCIVGSGAAALNAAVHLRIWGSMTLLLLPSGWGGAPPQMLARTSRPIIG